MKKNRFKKLGRIPGVMGLIMLVGFFGIAFTILSLGEIPEGSKDLIKSIITMLGMMLMGLRDYHFGEGTDEDEQ